MDVQSIGLSENARRLEQHGDMSACAFIRTESILIGTPELGCKLFPVERLVVKRIALCLLTHSASLESERRFRWLLRLGKRMIGLDKRDSQANSMMSRTRRETVVFKRPFRIAGIEHQIPAGSYELVTDEELIEGLSFPCYRRVATMMTVPAARSSALETVLIDPRDLEAAQRADREAHDD